MRKADALVALDKASDAQKVLDDAIKLDDSEPLLKSRKAKVDQEIKNALKYRVFGRSAEELKKKMHANPRIARMMQEDATLMDRAEAARNHPDF